jgi:hypothetical protein
MGLNVSNVQVAQEQGLCQSDCQRVNETMCLDVVKRKTQVRLEKAVECDEVYIVAGYKGIPKAIKNRDPRRNRLEEWGYLHKTVNHSQCEYARDEDGDGFHEVHVDTMEGFWSLLRSWLRPHRGISQEKLLLYLGFFEFIHTVRKRGQALLELLLSFLLQPKICLQNTI